MTYEDRQQFRELKERVAALKTTLEDEGRSGGPSRQEAVELLELLDQILDRVSPERWDRAMETIVDEAARRAATVALPG